MNKFFILIILIFMISSSFADSIFSPLGFIEENFGVDNFSAGMGQTGISSLNRRNLSAVNPALNTTVVNSNFFSKVDLSFTDYKAEAENSFETRTSSFPYMKVIVPLSKKTNLGFKFFDRYHLGLQTSLEDSLTNIGNLDYENSNEGEINQFGLSLAKEIRNIALGLEINFNYGYKINNSNIDFADSDFRDYSEYFESLMKGINFTFGFAMPFSNFSLGGFYQTKTKLDCDKEHRIEYEDDPELDFISNSTSTYELPAELGLGCGYEFNDQFYFETNYRQNFWSSVSNSIVKTDDSQFISAGLSYFPYDSKWLVPLRFGGYYKKLPYQENGNPISEQALTFGFDLPLKYKNKGIVNLVFSYGTRGNVSDNGISDEFFGISVGFSSFDRWLNPKKYKKNKMIPEADPNYISNSID